MSGVEKLLADVAACKPKAVARAISIIEDSLPGASDLMAALEAANPHSVLIGITGPAGVGKSSLVNCLLSSIKQRARRVGVLAIDPSSERTQGALLGDRIRMMQHATDSRVIIRSMATRGMLGGLSRCALAACRVMALAGCDPILLETTGVGQVETAIARYADVVMVVLCPGSGDEIQAMKAGLLEIAELIVINKSDRPGAAEMMGWLQSHLTGTEVALHAASASREQGIGEIEADLALRETHVRKSRSFRMGGKLLSESAVVDGVLFHLRTFVEEMVSATKTRVTDPDVLAQSIINACSREARLAEAAATFPPER